MVVLWQWVAVARLDRWLWCGKCSFFLFGFGLGFQFVGVVGGRGGGFGFAGSGSGGSYEFARLWRKMCGFVHGRSFFRERKGDGRIEKE